MAQNIILFENVLAESISNNQEISRLAQALLGESDLSLVKPEKAQDLQYWLNDEVQSAVRGNRAMVYLFKTPIKELLVENPDKNYQGELKAIILTPKGYDKKMIVITCCWKDIFINNLLPIGVVAGKDDIEEVIKSL